MRRLTIADHDVLRRIDAVDLYALTERKITDEGYLVAPARLAAAGNVQDYRASELGLDADGVPADKVISLYRPTEEVFAPDCMKSFDGKPVTNGHPPENVTADNWTEYAVGDCRDVGVDGAFLKGVLTIRDRAAVRDVIDGKSQMSCGYSFDLDMTSGTTADGKQYHGVMRNIRGNHHAIVDQARGGPGCRIADHQPENSEIPAAWVPDDLVGIEKHIHKATTGGYFGFTPPTEPAGLIGVELHIFRAQHGHYNQGDR
jgi:hypothetical protein